MHLNSTNTFGWMINLNITTSEQSHSFGKFHYIYMNTYIYIMVGGGAEFKLFRCQTG